MSLKWVFKTCAQPTKCEYQHFSEGFEHCLCCWPPYGHAPHPRPFETKKQAPFANGAPLLERRTMAWAIVRGGDQQVAGSHSNLLRQVKTLRH